MVWREGERGREREVGGGWYGERGRGVGREVAEEREWVMVVGGGGGGGEEKVVGGEGNGMERVR